MHLVSPLLPDEACASWLKSADSVSSGCSETLAMEDAILYELFLRADTICELPGAATHSVCQWDGPNLFSAFTSTADVFEYLSGWSFPGHLATMDGLLWLEVHLVAYDSRTFLAEWGYPFFLCAKNSFLGSLANLQSQIIHVVSDHAEYQFAKWNFQLILRPRRDLRW